ncbi:RNA 2',3'-cyclic phosphodiesterase [Knoellia sp. 3-2P3]|uniref:RNA 2',3'-cyclic phosphodiesterase n=1 Tax=unclassified Knoellia TaxID=2618719 RepID=UPI0023D9B9B6|nr:RNA 2',3'-cyclic phosphodiesterase [Knoellia sp. 3-2P3]MDF2092917.1 RNA 2',3'-cyclic phosphodiesterase [Knoellia sp. 3-2P3]
MRMFVAVVPPDEALDDLADYLEPRQEAGAELRWTDPNQWHVTLSFMGEVPDRVVEPLVERLGRRASRFAPETVRIEGAGAFPNPYRARVLWAGVAEDVDGGLRSLATGIRHACSAAGAAPEGGRFHPHVTLARLRRPMEATRWLRVLEGYAGPAWTAGEVSLIASHLGEGRGNRPRYEEVATFPLGPGQGEAD